MILPIVGGPAAGRRESKASAVAVVLGSRVGRSSVINHESHDPSS